MQQTCHNPWCKQSFDVTAEDFAFYEKVSPVFSGKKELILPPKLCPDCRQQRRWALRNEHVLYRRNCDYSGKPMISLFPADSPYIVYSQESYRNGAWDGLSAGHTFDFSLPFFDQFHSLLLAVPHRGLQQDETNVNCDFTTYGGGNKNCYMTAACMYCEDVYYSTRCAMTKDSVDCFLCVRGELLYECIYCIQCYNLLYSKDCYNCRDSLLLDHCHNCSHCIACTNLRNKEYHIYNKPVPPEEFEDRKTKLLQGSIGREREQFDAWKITLPCLFAHLTHAENVTGDYIDSAKNCMDCFGIQVQAEDCRYCQFCGMQTHDFMDAIMCGLGDLFYETVGVGPAHRCAFLTYAEEADEVYYSNDILHCQSCFGCTGLQHKSFCILNKQYTKEEYEKLVPKIIGHMRSTGEYGEFFPARIAVHPYNDTVAQEYFPLSKGDVEARGWPWRDEDPSDSAKNGQSFKYIKQELAFYQKIGIQPPTLPPRERHRRRARQCNPHHLWSRQCQKCGKDIRTTYSPERPEIIYCEECYLQEVY
ncbi:MAG: hypothetical protein V1926_04200 [Candidatus Peregrinibacteria bacterium]